MLLTALLLFAPQTTVSAARYSSPPEAHGEPGDTTGGWAVLPAPPPPPPEGRDIEAVLQASALAWNAGDLKGFTSFYEEDAVFLTKDRPAVGRNSIYLRYILKYGPRNRQATGQLTFGQMFTRMLTPEWAIEYGRYNLKVDPATAGETGVFDLIMHKTAQGWRIASDHTS